MGYTYASHVVCSGPEFLIRTSVLRIFGKRPRRHRTLPYAFVWESTSDFDPRNGIVEANKTES